MGKGIIKSGGADGFYNVELTFERDRISETIATIDAHIEYLTSVIDTMDEGTEKELLKLERNSYIKKKEYLQNNMPEDPTVSAWCADLTEDITGNVGTIEVPGERGIVQIQPGYENNSTYNATRDGQLQPSIASTPEATFYNLAMLPGWQKWKPTYRYGVISNIDTDANTCNVKLDEIKSSQQNLDINQELNLTGIDVSYMNCDSIAFEDGDNVLVKFVGQTWTGAQVVGFKDNPKACEYEFYIRPTFNGYSPTYGGESIKLENDETSEQSTTVVDGYFAGLCGPFTQDVDIGNEDIFLSTSVGAGVNPNYSGVNNIFAHFTEVAEEDAAYSIGYNFETLDWFGAGKKQFEIGDGTGTPILHVNRVNWLRYANIIEDCPKTTEVINEVEYIIYRVDFTDLYFPAMTYTLKKYLSTWPCAGCGAQGTSQEAPISYGLVVEDIVADQINSSNICIGYELDCAYENENCKSWSAKAISGHTPEIEILKEQICILSDEYGNSASYTPITINTNLYILEQYITHPYGVGKICEVLDTDNGDDQEFKYEMTLAPENKF